ncbi:MAG: CvpA family protein [Clostridia bacterium]|nr:CvpA family protein [Clostridia bacterium]
MSIVIDIILVATAGLIIFGAWRRGLVKSVIGLVCTVVSILVAYALTPPVANFLCNHVFLDRISSGISSSVRSAASSPAGTDVSQFLSKIPETLAGTLEKYDIGSESFRQYIGGLSDTGEGAVKGVSDFIARPTSRIISNVLAFIVLFIVAMIVLRLVSKLILVIFKAPIIRTADHIAGLALGTVSALIVLWVLSLALSAGVNALGNCVPSWFGDTVSNSVILKFFASNNPITVLNKVLTYVGI